MTDSNVPSDKGSTHRTSSSLLNLAARRDPEAWRRLVDLYTPLIVHWCKRWRLQPVDVQNLCQEVFIAVAESLAGYDHGRGSFRGWLFTITRSKLIDHVRKEGPDVTGVGGSDALQRQQLIAENLPDDEATLSEEKKLLYARALQIIRGSFSELDWQAFNGVVCNGRTPAEMAEKLLISVNKVYLAKSHILRLLREEFRELIEEWS
jgi:RNA polymerase sigma-70 factor (ECF subfamily)